MFLDRSYMDRVGLTHGWGLAMALVADPGIVADDGDQHDVIDAEIVGARIVDPKFVDGRIVDGRIVGGRLADTARSRFRMRRARGIDREHAHGEVVAVIAFVLAALLVYVIRF
jgi:hypothetical protein